MLMRHLSINPNISATKSARYWRLLANDISWVDPYASAAYFHAVCEFEFYATSDATGTNLCMGKTAAASSTTNAASYANDANTTTTYTQSSSSGVIGHNTGYWWSIDLTTSTAVKAIMIYPFSSTDGFHAKSYKVQYSDDNSTWSDLTTINTTQNGKPQTFINLQ